MRRQHAHLLAGHGNWQLVGEFTEVERAKRSDRPELAAALAACKRHKAKLVIAKLDRLSRNLAFIAALMDSGVEFIAVDNPHANKLTVHILAVCTAHKGRAAAAQRIEAARRLFPRIWFNQVTTQPGIDALGAYHAKRDEQRLVDLGPEHDWASHAADAFGMMCIAYEEPVSRPDRPYQHRFHKRSWLSI